MWYKLTFASKKSFCKKCGANFFYKRLNFDKISISSGKFDNLTLSKISCNIFTKNRLDFYKLDSKLPKFNRDST